MSNSDSQPQILVNGEQEQEAQPPDTDVPAAAAAAEGEVEEAEREEEAEQVCPSAAEDRCAEEEKARQHKMRSVLHQVRKQIRSQGGARAPKSSILELVQRVKELEAERTQAGGEAEEGGGADATEQELCAAFEEKLEACKKALRDEFEQSISQLREEMRVYTDAALKTRQEVAGAEGQKQRPPATAAPSLAARRGRVLTRTLTTIIPKTCAPVIVCPRAKSETVTYSRGARSRLLPRDPAPASTGCRPHQSRRPLPPAYPQTRQQGKKPVRGKAKTEN